MSIGNLKDSGNQGNNLPFQWKVLQGLQEIANQVGQPLTCVEDSVTICNDNIDAFTFTNIAGDDALNVNIAGGVTLEVNLDAANDQVGVYGYTNPADPSTYTGIKTDASGVLAIQDNGGSITVDGGTGPQRIPTFLRPSGSNGTVGPNIYSASFASVGTANAIVGGINLKPGETLNFDAGAINNTLAAITYNTLTNSGAELIIITLT
jgi:hypothetical protein